MVSPPNQNAHEGMPRNHFKKEDFLCLELRVLRLEALESVFRGFRL